MTFFAVSLLIVVLPMLTLYVGIQLGAYMETARSAVLAQQLTPNAEPINFCRAEEGGAL
jgi:hypothetical protein